MIFSKKIPLQPYKEYLLRMCQISKPTIITDTEGCFTMSINKEGRNISISLNNMMSKGYVTVDVTDIYAIIRIPRTKFSKLEEYKEFCINSLGFLQT